MKRCYDAGIPDTAPALLMSKNMVPTWNGVALALLKNDLNLISLGFATPSSRLESQLVLERKRSKAKQLELRL